MRFLKMGLMRIAIAKFTAFWTDKKKDKYNKFFDKRSLKQDLGNSISDFYFTLGENVFLLALVWALSNLFYGCRILVILSRKITS